ncbi:hypothetical protein BT96DRAFT_984793 [Gymnopus androsaceus JB14]|uniref:Uncharacterized protein n=1 Tax=Gymnopus androsaceus JB14 TaxID=1447944 RepID=A0A6A4IMV0_9AGAR|nr:hypothetical protein BT96DRAFT_984793 [Gymnopus androsaceus JB14]
MQWMRGYTGYERKDQYDQIAETADRMLALYAICHSLVLPGSPFTRLDDTITNTAKERYGEQMGRMSKGGSDTLIGEAQEYATGAQEYTTGAQEYATGAQEYTTKGLRVHWGGKHAFPRISSFQQSLFYSSCLSTLSALGCTVTQEGSRAVYDNKDAAENSPQVQEHLTNLAQIHETGFCPTIESLSVITEGLAELDIEGSSQGVISDNELLWGKDTENHATRHLPHNMDLILPTFHPYDASYFNAAQGANPNQGFPIFIARTWHFTDRKHITIEHPGEGGYGGAETPPFAEINVHFGLIGDSDTAVVRGREVRIIDHGFGWK